MAHFDVVSVVIGLLWCDQDFADPQPRATRICSMRRSMNDSEDHCMSMYKFLTAKDPPMKSCISCTLKYLLLAPLSNFLYKQQRFSSNRCTSRNWGSVTTSTCLPAMRYKLPSVLPARIIPEWLYHSYRSETRPSSPHDHSCQRRCC